MALPRAHSANTIGSWESFTNGNIIVFDSNTENDASMLAQKLSAGISYDELFDYFRDSNDKIDYDRIAYAAACAFKANLIDDEHLAILLDLRTIKTNPNFSLKIIPILDETDEVTSTANETLTKLMTSVEIRRFLKTLKTKPRSKQVLFQITITGDDLVKTGIQSLLSLTEGQITVQTMNTSVSEHASLYHKILTEEETGNEIKEVREITSATLTLLCLGAENVMLEAKHGENTKRACPVLGKFSIDLIDYFIRNKARPIAYAFPGIDNATSFHNVIADMFYLNLHDRAHRRLISSIANLFYDAYLAAIDLVRSATRIHWSHEIWLSTDMEIGVFINLFQGNNQLGQIDFTLLSDSAKLSYFAELLKAQVLSTKEPMGLFTPSPFNDTMWLLLIDMTLNKNKWETLQVKLDESDYPPDYGEFLSFINDPLHLEKLQTLDTPARQVAYIKAKYFEYLNVPYDDSMPCEFVKVDRHIQLSVNGEFAFGNKKQLTALTGLDRNQTFKLIFDNFANREQFVRLLPYVLSTPQVNGSFKGLYSDKSEIIKALERAVAEAKTPPLAFFSLFNASPETVKEAVFEHWREKEQNNNLGL